MMNESPGQKNHSSDPNLQADTRADDGPQGVLLNSNPKLAEKPRFSGLLASFILVFMLPTLIGIGYYTFIASERYAAGSSFVIRGLDSGGSTDFASSFTGMISSGSTTSDSYIVRKFMKSPDLLQQIDDILDLRTHYSTQAADSFSRFNNEESFEEFVKYWQGHILTTYDSTTGIVSFEVQAFDAATSKKIAEIILERIDSLVNSLSDKARRESVKFATDEVKRTENRLLAAQTAIQEFRNKSGSIDPEFYSQLDIQLIASLEAQLADIQLRIKAMSSEVNSEAPRLRQLRLQAKALSEQIQLRRAAIADSDTTIKGSSTASKLTEFESLKIEQTFAQQLYATALSSLESSRIDADRRQRYLGVFSRPLTPEEAVYPQRLRNSFICIAGFLALWVIGTLLTLAVRDHLR